MSRKRVFSGMQPTNRLHLGNYLGALQNWVKLQAEDSECIYCIVDLHAITVPHDPTQLVPATREVTAAYVGAGVDPAHSIIFAQSTVSAHAELTWLLGTMTQIGELNRMTQFKDKSGKHREKASLGLYAYPVLMAADILAYKATHVPVGEDQKQHLELAREIARTFNFRFERELFPVPEPHIIGEGTRVMSLRNGSEKMSKSAESDMSRINLVDDADTIALKLRKAKTDPEPLPEATSGLEGRPEAANLVNIYAALMDQTPAQVLTEYGGRMFSDFKPILTDVVVEKLAPIAQRIRDLLDHPDEIDRILASGTEKANAIAEPVLDEVAGIMGFWRPPSRG